MDYQQMIKGGVEPSKSQKCADAAIATLREAVAVGLSPQRLESTSLAPLHGLQRFQHLLAGARADHIASGDALSSSNQGAN